MPAVTLAASFSQVQWNPVTMAFGCTTDLLPRLVFFGTTTSEDSAGEMRKETPSGFLFVKQVCAAEDPSFG